MTPFTKKATIVALVAIAAPIAFISTTKASDHADTPEIFASPGTDLTDVYMFPSPTNPNNVVLAMNVHPLIGPGMGGSVGFDPNVLYQFKIDTNGDYVEDKVIQFAFFGRGPNQTFAMSGPVAPTMTGTRTQRVVQFGRGGPTNHVSDSAGVKIFAGPREDSFFFDLEQFFNILPDRASSITGTHIANPNQPLQTSWRPKGQAVDFLSNGGYNVLSIVVEMPKSMILTSNETGHRNIGVWCTTSVRKGSGYDQMDRLARPVVNEVFATVANNRHKVNDENNPTDDPMQLKNDVESFLTFPAGRSRAIKDVIEAVLVPDVLKADLDGVGGAYLGVETGGATGGTFGGRMLTDDVVDLSLYVVFGTGISDLGLAPADGHDIPSLTSDHVGPEGKHFTNTFPFIGAPR